jgi:hypothetical protein
MTRHEAINMAIEQADVEIWKLLDGEMFAVTDAGFAAAVHILHEACLTKMWILQERERMPQADREAMAEAFGAQLRDIIKIFTDIDTHNFYCTCEGNN